MTKKVFSYESKVLDFGLGVEVEHDGSVYVQYQEHTWCSTETRGIYFSLEELEEILRVARERKAEHAAYIESL